MKSCHRAPRELHSFPTRRSSDLPAAIRTGAAGLVDRSPGLVHGGLCLLVDPGVWALGDPGAAVPARVHPLRTRTSRSEEHTSELQSRLHLVCRLLLEKKKLITR